MHVNNVADHYGWMRNHFDENYLKFVWLSRVTLYEKQPVYLHSMLAAPLPSCSLRSNKGISLLVPSLRPTQAQELFTLVPVSLKQPPAVCPFSHFSCYCQETSEDTSFCHGLSLIDQHAWWLIDVTELLHQICCWIPIWLSFHWTWFHRGVLAL